jgi:HEAT repeat protein
LTRVLNRTEGPERIQAANALGEIGPGAKAAVPALIERLQDKEAEARISATRALGRIGPQAQKAAPALNAALDSKDSIERRTAAVALLRIGSHADAAVRELIRAMKSEEGSTGFAQLNAATDLLENIGPGAVEAISILAETIDDADAGNRWVVVSAIGRIGPAAKAASPKVENVLRDREPRVRLAAAFALWSIEKRQTALVYLIQQLKSTDSADRQLAAEMLGAIGPEAGEAVPALLALAKDGEPWAIDALERVDPTIAKEILDGKQTEK